DIITPGAGNDYVYAGNGDDLIRMGRYLTSADHIYGQGGTDTVDLKGNYYGGLTLGATTISGVENLILETGYSYKIDATALSKPFDLVDASSLSASEHLIFFGSASDVLGGLGNDRIDLSSYSGPATVVESGGNDNIIGGSGDDVFGFGSSFTADDRIDGGGGTNTLNLSGHDPANTVMTASTLQNIQNINIDSGHFNFTTNDANVAAGQTLSIISQSAHLDFDGSGETDGNFFVEILNTKVDSNTLIGGNGNDTLIAYGESNTFEGGGGADSIHAGRTNYSANDTFVYNAVSDSTGSNHDFIDEFVPSDHFSLPVAVTGVDAAIYAGTLPSGASFDADLTADIGSNLAPHHAVLVGNDDNDKPGIWHAFLVIDANGIAGYQAGQDYVIEVGRVNPDNLTVDNFIQHS
ncbi:MAG TPA: hypothetical protein VG867_02155, partial [Rhizomicrobium sp.]|nr:hypothetical protein [Rhizomicrobium sp.]